MRVLALTIVLASAIASANAEPCKTQGAADARELALDLDNDRIRQGLDISLQLGLLPAEFPLEDIRAIKTPCSRGSFPVFAHAFELFGEDSDLPPRWAVSPTAANVMTMYLAMMPKPEPALAWYEKTRPKGSVEVQFKPDEYMYALTALTEGGSRLIFTFFDKIPDDTTLKDRMRKMGVGEARWLVGFDVEERTTAVNPQR